MALRWSPKGCWRRITYPGKGEDKRTQGQQPVWSTAAVDLQTASGKDGENEDCHRYCCAWLALLICGNSHAQAPPPTPAPATTPTPAKNADSEPIFVPREYFVPQEIRPDWRNVCDGNVANQAFIVGGVSSSALKPGDAVEQLEKQLKLMRSYVAEKQGEIQMMERVRTLKNPQPGKAESDPPFQVRAETAGNISPGCSDGATPKESLWVVRLEDVRPRRKSRALKITLNSRLQMRLSAVKPLLKARLINRIGI